MRFIAKCSTDDGRLTKGKCYDGSIVSWYDCDLRSRELRIVVYDNKKEWMTFDPKVFVPTFE